jgi:ubiquitin-like protein Pup
MAESRRTERGEARSESTEDLDVEATIPAHNDALDEGVDAILEEIDAVLEENAEDFVKSFVQKGGQ